jgi:hypothetical protein
MSNQRLLCILLILPFFTMCEKADSVLEESPGTGGSIRKDFVEFDYIVNNPWVGLYRWINREHAPVPTMDSYNRFFWSSVETSPGVYDFSKMKAEAENARTDPDGKGTYGFGIRCMDTNTDRAYPAYLDPKMNAWYSDIKKCWVPDWNNEYFLTRLDSMVAALGREFNKDPRIGFIEIRSYGNWGEWHMSGYENPVAPAVKITVPTIQRMINMYVKAFPNKQIIMMSDNPDGLDYAMSITGLTYPIGWRRDSWCNPVFPALKNSAAWPKASIRWKTAPVIVEGYGSSGTGENYPSGLSQVIEYHVSSIANNFDKWSSMTQTDKDLVMNSAKIAGYRFVLRSLTYPSTLVSGVSATIKSIWSNVGVAPVYQNWKVSYRLCDKISGVVKGEIPSSLNLRTLLPTLDQTTKIDTPIVIEDAIVLPSGLAIGEYELELCISDPTGYRLPLRLAIAGRKSNGAYSMGSIKFGN